MISIKDKKLVEILCSPECFEKIVSILKVVDDKEINDLISELHNDNYEVIFKDMFGNLSKEENKPRIVLAERIPF